MNSKSSCGNRFLPKKGNKNSKTIRHTKGWLEFINGTLIIIINSTVYHHIIIH